MAGTAWLGQLIATLGVDASGLNQGVVAMQQFQRTSSTIFDRVNADLERTANQFQRFGSAASRYLTLPLVAVGGSALKLASDLEFTTQKVVALGGVSQTQMNAWQSSITRIGNATNQTSNSIAETLYYVASAGVRSKEAMEITEMAAKGAAAGLGQMESIGRLATYALNAYGKENIKASYVMDVLSTTIREGTAEASTLAQVMGAVLPVASSMGVSFDQVGGSLAAMTRTGFNAFTAATSLRQIMVSLLKPTHEANAAFETMGTSATELRATIREKGLLAALIEVLKLTEKYGESVSGMAFPNVRALTGELSLTGRNLEENIEIMEKTQKAAGDFENVFSIMTQTTSFRAASMRRAMENAFLGLGQAMQGPLISIMKSVTDTINDLANWFKSLNETTQTSILTFGAFLIAVGPVALFIAGFIKIVAGLRIAFIALSAAGTIVNAVLLANPAIAIAAGVTILAGALMYAVSSTEKLTVAQKALQDVNESANREVVSETVKLEQLVRVANNKYATDKQRAEAIKTINTISPEYLGYINEEAIRTGTATIGINMYIESLRNKARLQAATTALETLEAERVSELAAGRDRQLTTMQKINSVLAPLFQLQTIGNTIAATEVINAKASADAYDQKKLMLQGVADETLRLIGVTTSLNKTQEQIDRENKERIEKELAAQKRLADAQAAQLAKEEAVKKALAERESFAKRIADSDKNYEDGLKRIAIMSELFGKQVENNVVQFDAEQEAIQVLNRYFNDQISIYGKITPLARDLANQLDRLVKISKIPIKVTKAVSGLSDLDQLLKGSAESIARTILKIPEPDTNAFTNSMRKIERGLRLAGDAARDMISSYMSILDSMQEKTVRAMEERAKRQHKSDKWIAKQREAIEADYGRKKKTAAIAEAVINVALGITKAFSQTGIYGFISAGLIAAAGAMQIAAINAQPMAQGGIVPSGYPNDSYPARLTSGEMVIPPGKLKNVISPQTSSLQFKPVVFKIGEREIVGLLEQAGVMSKSY